MNHDSKSPITLEQLLRLKRVERPGAEFWQRFDQELRAKQLAALVGKRPWWQTLPRTLFSGGARLYAPIGAATVLGVTFLAVRGYWNPAADFAPAGAPVSVASATHWVSGNESHMEFLTVDPVFEETIALSTEVELETPEMTQVAVAGAEAMPSSPSSAMTSLLDSSPHVRALPEEVRVSIREPATRFASLPEGDSLLTGNLLGANRGFESRALAARPVVEPLQQMAAPREVRRRQMLAAIVSMNVDAPAPSGTNVVRNMPDERLYEQIHRFSGRGDRFSLKF